MPEAVAEVCLTFDNGPEPEVTPGVLAVLARRRIRATFFLVGQKLRDAAARACAERAQAEGHAIGNHTLTHGAPLGTRSAAEAVAEIAGTDALLGALHGPEKLFRANGGGGVLGPHLLNRAAAVAMRDGPAAGLALIDALLARGDLEDYRLAHSARADLCRRLGRTAEARASYQRALALTLQEPERRFLERRLRELPE